MIDPGMRGETFTERCRRMLTEQPKQAEFTLSRGGLETLVLDSERLAERNLESSRRHATHVSLTIEENMALIRRRYPAATIEKHEFSAWLTVPGVKLPKGFNKKQTTIYVEVPAGFPGVGPERFWIDDDLRYAGGGRPTHSAPQYTSIGPVEKFGKTGLLLCFWRVQRWNPRDTLYGYVLAMTRFFPAALVFPESSAL